MAARNITCDCGCGTVLGTAAEPQDQTWTEDKWSRVLSGYRCQQDATQLGVERLDTNDAGGASDWMDCEHHNKLHFNVAPVNGPSNELPLYATFVLAIEHSADGVSADGEITTQDQAGSQQGVDIDAYKYVRFKVKTVEGNDSWVSIAALTEYSIG